jgi:hypothetical protein
MSNFKEATKQKLRFTTTKGSLSVEQLWDLSVEELDTLAVSLEKEYGESGKKSFLVTKSVKDKKTKLMFDVALEVLTTKLEEAEVAAKKKEDKEHNDKIFELIAQKQDDKLKGMSVAELKKQIRS